MFEHNLAVKHWSYHGRTGWCTSPSPATWKRKDG